MATMHWFVVSVLVLVSFHIRTTSCGIIDEQACANNVQRECQCNIDFDVNGDGEESKELCSKLQVYVILGTMG